MYLGQRTKEISQIFKSGIQYLGYFSEKNRMDPAQWEISGK